MNFDDIRPYRDEEVKDKIKNLIAEEQFQQMIGFIRPDVDFEEMKQLMESIFTVYDFQSKFIVPLLDVLIGKTTNGVSFHGLENLEKGKSGIGLVNAKKRLALIYPETHNLSIKKDNDFFLVDVTLAL